VNLGKICAISGIFGSYQTLPCPEFVDPQHF